MTTFKDSIVEGNQPLVYAVTQIAFLSLQCCHDFQTRKLAYNAISFYVNYIEHVIKKNNTLSLYDNPTDVNVFAISLNYISSTTWTKQNKEHPFLRKLSSLDSILYIIFTCPFNRPRRLFKVWHLFPFHSVYFLKPPQKLMLLEHFEICVLKW